MSTAPQQERSPMQHALASHGGAPIEVPRYDDTELGCESAYPFLQFDAWEPLDSQRAAGSAPGY